MAKVTSLTAERMLKIEAASVVDGEINETGHLILTTHGGTQIDAGHALVAVPDASNTQKGVVKLATNTEVAEGTDTTKAVTPAGLSSLGIDARLDALEAQTIPDASDTQKGLVELATDEEVAEGTDTTRAVTPAGLASLGYDESLTVLESERILRLQPSFVQSSPVISYPEGESLLHLTALQAADGGWDFSGKHGTVRTIRFGTQASQTWARTHQNTVHPELWVRGGNTTTGWSPWRKLTDDVVESDSLATGWYRVGSFVTVQGGPAAKASAEFVISTDGSGQHTFLRLRASVAFNYARASLSVEECSGYGLAPTFTKARIVALFGTYGGHALELYCPTMPADGNIQMVVKHDDWRTPTPTQQRRWSSLGFAPAASTPPAPETVLLQRGIGYTGSWIPIAAFTSGWSNYAGAGGYDTAAYKMEPGGRVYLRGLISGGTVDVNGGSPFFTLPEGYRPERRQLFSTIGGGNAIARVDVLNDGKLAVIAGANSYIGLDGLSWIGYQ